MARPGVTYNDVTKAAFELTGQGKLPTIMCKFCYRSVVPWREPSCEAFQEEGWR
jgi:hypothetical protein